MHHFRTYCHRHVYQIPKVCKVKPLPSEVHNRLLCSLTLKRYCSGTVQVHDNKKFEIIKKSERVGDVQYAEALAENLVQSFPERYHFLISLGKKHQDDKGKKLFCFLRHLS